MLIARLFDGAVLVEQDKFIATGPAHEVADRLVADDDITLVRLG